MSWIVSSRPPKELTCLKIKKKKKRKNGAGDIAPRQNACSVIARCAVQSPAGNKSKHTQSRKQIYSFKSLGQASTSLSHRTNVNAVDKKVLVCAGIRYKGLRGQRKRSLLRSWARVEQAAILESGSRCPVAPPSVRALKPLAFGARLEGRESIPTCFTSAQKHQQKSTGVGSTGLHHRSRRFLQWRASHLSHPGR